MEEGAEFIMTMCIPESERSASGSWQLTAAAFLSLVRTVVLVKMVNREDRRKEDKVGNGMEMSIGTLFIIWHSFSPFITLGKVSDAGDMGILRYRGECGVLSVRRDLVLGGWRSEEC